jgi:hypothetical protein
VTRLELDSPWTGIHFGFSALSAAWPCGDRTWDGDGQPSPTMLFHGPAEPSAWGNRQWLVWMRSYLYRARASGECAPSRAPCGREKYVVVVSPGGPLWTHVTVPSSFQVTEPMGSAPKEMLPSAQRTFTSTNPGPWPLVVVTTSMATPIAHGRRPHRRVPPPPPPPPSALADAHDAVCRRLAEEQRLQEAQQSSDAFWGQLLSSLDASRAALDPSIFSPRWRSAPQPPQRLKKPQKPPQQSRKPYQPQTRPMPASARRPAPARSPSPRQPPPAAHAYAPWAQYALVDAARNAHHAETEVLPPRALTRIGLNTPLERDPCWRRRPCRAWHAPEAHDASRLRENLRATRNSDLLHRLATAYGDELAHRVPPRRCDAPPR